MKKIDKLMVKSFVGPFLVTFAIAMFVLIMQALWQYLDRIAGKGLSFFTVIELLSYKCVGLVPLALPLGLLIASVMVLGGMAEHYELSSMKSSGTGLLRVMRPLIIFGVVCAGVSFSVSDYVIPAANLQFGARMYDINQKKPTLSMEPGMFNTDFNQYAIRLGERDNNGRDIADILMYDHSRASTGNLGQITAKEGEMFASADGRSFIMQLDDGVQYSERRPSGSNRKSLPFVRTHFDRYTKVFDLSEFDLGQTSTALFETNRSMLATWQLRQGVDSINTDIAIRKQSVSNQAATYLPLLRKDTIVYREEWTPDFDEHPFEPGDSLLTEELVSQVDIDLPQDTEPTIEPTEGRKIIRIGSPDRTSREETQAQRERRQLEASRDHRLVRRSVDWSGIHNHLELMEPEGRSRVYNRARSGVRTIVSQAGSAQRVLPGVYESRVKYYYDWHMKYSMSLVCIIFIFIGAPMGAIVRKGGFGYPILVSIIFFVIFIILTIFCRKLAESFVVSGWFAGWLPCIILFPVSLYITNRAMKDAKLVNLDSFWIAVRKVFSKLPLTDRGAAAGPKAG